MKSNNSDKKNKILAKLSFAYFMVLPVVLTIVALAFTFIKFTIRKFEYSGGVKYWYDFGVTNIFAGSPQIIAFVAIIFMLACFFVIPKSMLKVRKSGDGLGLLFLPLGLLGIFEIMTAIESLKDLGIGIVFGLALFIVSALATFKKTIGIASKASAFMLVVALFLFFANFIPYCYNIAPVPINSTPPEMGHNLYYSINTLIRDLCFISAFGIFCDRIAGKYKEINTSKKK